MNIVISICLIYMLFILLFTMGRIIVLSREKRLKYIKNFKRGQFALIYFALIPLYYLACRYSQLSIDASVWQAIKSSIDLVVLKYDFSTASALMASNLYYKIAVELGFALVTLNAFILTFSLCGLKLLNMISVRFTCKLRKKVVVIVDYNPNSVDILKSVTKKDGKAVLMGDITPQLKDDAYIYKANYISLEKNDDFGKKILKLFHKFDNKQVSVILNCEDDSKSLRYAKQLCKMMDEEKLKDLPLTKACGLKVYVFASKTTESSFIHYVEESRGLIKFVNRYMQIAMDFVDNYPMTEFMTEKQIDYSTATIRDRVDLNMLMIGFGNVNESIFLTSVSNNQFLTIQNGQLQPKAIRYHIYDRPYPIEKITKDRNGNNIIQSRILNHGYYRYSEFLKEIKSRENEYLELIPEPAEIHIHSHDFSHPEFYGSVRETLSGGKDSYSYIVVSFGSDMENIDLAKKLYQKLQEWNIASFVKIFVKIRDEKLAKEIRDDFTNEEIQMFGTNKGTVYNASKILNEKMEQMAKFRHLIYTAESMKKKGESFDQESLERAAREKWYNEYKQYKRESNIFACLSLRMKLQLLGYDYVDEGEDHAEEFEAKYEKGDKRRSTSQVIDGKMIWEYKNKDQQRNSIRWHYAVQEHQRWCANMICHGLIPSTREQIETSDGDMPNVRRHDNLTTMRGLVEYRELRAEKPRIAAEKSNEKLPENLLEAEDVIRYDYQLMDDAVWLLHKCNYKLVKKRNHDHSRASI